jgi:hypothetical protein
MSGGKRGKEPCSDAGSRVVTAAAVAFVSLRRGLNRPDRPDLCFVPAPT